MKTVIYYECEICHTRYSDPGSAESCEKRGKLVPLPVGTIFTYGGIKGSMYHDIHFSIADNIRETFGHGYHPALRATRDNRAGDSLSTFCGFGGNSIKLGRDDMPDPSHPTFIRMVDYLKSVNIEPRVWDGEKSVLFVGSE
jgi:hypothetical protein